MLMIRLHRIIEGVRVTRELPASCFQYWSVPGGLNFEIYDCKGRVATYAIVYDAANNNKEWNVADITTLDGQIIGTFNDSGRVPMWMGHAGRRPSVG